MSNDNNNFFYKLNNNNLNENEKKVFQMFYEYLESDTTPYISRNYISEILGIPLNRIVTIVNNLIIKNLIIYDPESNKYRYNDF